MSVREDSPEFYPLNHPLVTNVGRRFTAKSDTNGTSDSRDLTRTSLRPTEVHKCIFLPCQFSTNTREKFERHVEHHFQGFINASVPEEPLAVTSVSNKNSTSIQPSFKTEGTSRPMLTHKGTSSKNHCIVCSFEGCSFMAASGDELMVHFQTTHCDRNPALSSSSSNPLSVDQSKQPANRFAPQKRGRLTSTGCDTELVAKLAQENNQESELRDPDYGGRLSEASSGQIDQARKASSKPNNARKRRRNIRERSPEIEQPEMRPSLLISPSKSGSANDRVRIEIRGSSVDIIEKGFLRKTAVSSDIGKNAANEKAGQVRNTSSNSKNVKEPWRSRSCEKAREMEPLPSLLGFLKDKKPRESLAFSSQSVLVTFDEDHFGVEIGKVVLGIVAHKPAKLTIEKMEDIHFLVNYADHPQEFVPYEVCLRKLAHHVCEYLAKHPVRFSSYRV